MPSDHSGAYRFDRFVLDPANRRLTEDGRTVELSGRYLDALVLLVVEEGRLVTKARFLDEVWKGVPVTDEALTQCVRALRKALGDEAGRPRFIETAPKHGYRFVAPVKRETTAPAARETAVAAGTLSGSGREALDRFVGMGRAGMIGGGAAGLVGGTIYGFAGVAGGGSGGAVSGLLVLAALTAVVGMIGGAAVGLGVGAAAFASGRRGLWGLVGGAAGGLAVGAVVRMVGLDAFTLLFGAAPQAITGAAEGALLGAAVGLGVWLATGRGPRLAAQIGALVAGAAGAIIALAGGRLMGGSLAALAAQFPDARLKLDHLGLLVGEARFGQLSQAVTAGLEGALFGAAMVLALSSQLRQPMGRSVHERNSGLDPASS